jgi:hypothetical protein
VVLLTNFGKVYGKMSSREQKKEVAREFIRQFVQQNRQRSLYFGGTDFLDRNLFPERVQME